MANLNEDVLRHIFSFLHTPLEWLKVSEVCKLWKLAASSKWQQITELSFLEWDITDRLDEYFIDNAKVISQEDATKMALCAAPYLKVLKASTEETDEECIEFGRFLYKVRDFENYRLLELLAENTHTLNEIHFFGLPRMNLLQKLFQKNHIKTIKCRQASTFFQNIRTEDLESLEELSMCYFNGADRVTSYAGYFPNLKKLELGLTFEDMYDVQRILSSILPFYPGLTSIHLHFSFLSNTWIPNEYFVDLTRLTELERLVLFFDDTRIGSEEQLLGEVLANNPKLKTVDLFGLDIYDGIMRPILNLPHLEDLSVMHALENFRLSSEKLPEVLNLTRLKLEYDHRRMDVNCFHNALKKMPKLVTLELLHAKFDPFNFNIPDGNQVLLQIVCNAITSAALYEKNVVVVRNSYRGLPDRFKIVRKDEQRSDSEIQTLNITVPKELDYHDEVLDYFDLLKSFLDKNLSCHCIVPIPYMRVSSFD